VEQEVARVALPHLTKKEATNASFPIKKEAR
jgi:hypothetical protein